MKNMDLKEKEKEMKIEKKTAATAVSSEPVVVKEKNIGMKNMDMKNRSWT